MREHDHLRPLAGELDDGRREALDAGEVGDPAVAQRDVEVGAHEDALSPDIDPVERAPVRHQSDPNRAAVSLIRFEKPHSLSYQPMTRVSALSITAVCGASKLQE